MKLARFFAVLVAAFFFAACAPKNVVHLGYPEAEAPAQAAGKARVYIVDFDDKRENGAVGERLNGEKILPRTSVARWLAASLAEELRRAGYAAVVTESMEQAVGQRPDFIVTGEIEEVRLTETSITRYTGAIRASVTLRAGNGEIVTKNSYSSVYSKAVLPIYGVPQTLLDEALAEMLQPASRLLVRTMQ